MSKASIPSKISLEIMSEPGMRQWTVKATGNEATVGERDDTAAATVETIEKGV